MVNFGSMNQATADLLKKISEQKEKEELQKEKEVIQSRLDTLESSLAKFKDKEVGEPLKNTPAPQGFPVKVSIHFSAPHLFKLNPSFDLFTTPDFFLHFAIDCDALAEGKTS